MKERLSDKEVAQRIYDLAIHWCNLARDARRYPINSEERAETFYHCARTALIAIGREDMALKLPAPKS